MTVGEGRCISPATVGDGKCRSEFAVGEGKCRSVRVDHLQGESINHLS